jgi:uncharacterized protein
MVSCLDVLEELYQSVLIPEAVFREVAEAGAGRAGTQQVAAARWLEHVQTPIPPDPLLIKELGPGEAEVIAVAYRLKARWTLLDERRARRIAEQAYGLRVKGSAGILVEAKRRRLIPQVKPLLEAMASQGYFISRRLIERACLEAGEQTDGTEG